MDQITHCGPFRLYLFCDSVIQVKQGNSKMLTTLNISRVRGLLNRKGGCKFRCLHLITQHFLDVARLSGISSPTEIAYVPSQPEVNVKQISLV